LAIQFLLLLRQRRYCQTGNALLAAPAAAAGEKAMLLGVVQRGRFESSWLYTNSAAAAFNLLVARGAGRAAASRSANVWKTSQPRMRPASGHCPLAWGSGHACK